MKSHFRQCKIGKVFLCLIFFGGDLSSAGKFPSRRDFTLGKLILISYFRKPKFQADCDSFGSISLHQNNLLSKVAVKENRNLIWEYHFVNARKSIFAFADDKMFNWRQFCSIASAEDLFKNYRKIQRMQRWELNKYSNLERLTFY